ncbi:glycosyltransferase family 1 protein [Mycena alexandri]|uniref:sterol 3beta-glucosyltransferase n=1 Tax=Mycena alexandri TaxID=1745969 RepID=A0AAD6XG76_9AGAR|nr:glycosyltransferase family 1 protein [Mycena alexandri]
MATPDTPSRSDTFSSDDDSLNSDPIPSTDNFYSEAAAFEQVLATNGCIEGRETYKDGKNGYEALVAKDLSEEEQGIACRAARLRATGSSPSWTPSPTSTIVEEPESYVEERDDSLDDSDDSSSTHCDIPPPVLKRSGTQTDAWRLEPEEVIRLLVNEFGPLAIEGEEEKLLLETDGGLVKEVAIVGVIHLTTHRLAFHASLMAARPDAQQGVIRAGTVLIHRKGWRSKRRLWLELSHDMMCTYASSSSSDKIRPIKTVLLSAIKKIVPMDPKQPKYVRLVFEKLEKEDISGIAEFDTEESARGWRKELSAAVFLYRHRRRQALDGSDVEDSAGVRFSCPLARIESAAFHDSAFPGIATLLINGEKGMPPRSINMGTIYTVPIWQKLPAVLTNYKKHRTFHPSDFDDMPIFVDMGPISFAEAQSDVEAANLKEQAVRNALALGAEPELWMTRASVHRTVASTGYFCVTTNYVSFWSKFFTQADLKYRIPLASIRGTRPFSLIRNCAYGLSLEIEGHPDLKFQFRTEEVRGQAITRIAAARAHAQKPHTPPATVAPTSDNGSNFSVRPLTRSASGIFAPLSRTLAAAIEGGHAKLKASLPRAINLPSDLLVRGKSKHFVCLTIGSRGDVQPYIALGLGLMKEGHTVTIVTHEEYKPWVESFGIKHKQAGGDPGALMKLSVENKMFSPEFFKESIQNFRPWLDQLLLDSWESCQGADVLLESPSAMSGVHIAEALNIPYFRTFTMPWTKTSEFPHAFLSPPVESPTFNAASYFHSKSSPLRSSKANPWPRSNVMWTATSGQINRWRRNTLKIGNTDMGHLAQSKIPFIYNFSQAVVPKPLDWGDATNISGYWFLDNAEGVNWTPPADLVEWMAKARKDGKAIVYIGFGSITVPHPNRVTARIVKAVLRADVRAIISKGWSARMSTANDKDPEVVIPPECYQLDKVPHDWLFPQIDAAVHHGGAGTTGASLRAGIPTLIKPWFGDQFFWASRVHKLGAGLRVPSLHAHDFSEALIKATTSRVMKEKAAAVGEKIRAENGVHTAIYTIYTYLDHASSYIEKIRQSH